MFRVTSAPRGVLVLSVLLQCASFRVLTKLDADGSNLSVQKTRSRSKSAIGLAGRMIRELIARLEEHDVDTILAKKATAAIDDYITTVVAEMEKTEDDKYVQELCAWADTPFSEAEVRSLLKDTYTQNQFSCAEEPSLESSGEDLVGKVFGLFGRTSMTTNPAVNPTIHFVTECMFRDITDRYGGEGGPWKAEMFDAWDEQHLAKYPGLQQVLTEELQMLHEYGNKVLSEADDAYFFILQACVELSNFLFYAAGKDESKRAFAYETMTKSFLVTMTPHLFAQVYAGNVKQQEAEQLRRAIFYDNIKWAVDYERANHPSYPDNKTYGDPENVKLGEQVLRIVKSCISFEYHDTPPQLRMTPGDAHAKNDGLLNRALSMYTLWNHRYVHYYNTQDAAKEICDHPIKKLILGGRPYVASKWAHAPRSILHTVNALVAPLDFSSSNLVEWTTFRLLGLEQAGASVKEDCTGAMSWRHTKPYLQHKGVQVVESLLRKFGITAPPGNRSSWNDP